MVQTVFDTILLMIKLEGGQAVISDSFQPGWMKTQKGMLLTLQISWYRQGY